MALSFFLGHGFICGVLGAVLVQPRTFPLTYLAWAIELLLMVPGLPNLRASESGLRRGVDLEDDLAAILPAPRC
jgi:pilus assembly protein TadC